MEECRAQKLCEQPGGWCMCVCGGGGGLLDCRSWMGCLAAHIHRLSETLDDVKKEQQHFFFAELRSCMKIDVAVLASRGRPGLSWPSWTFIQLLSFAEKRVLLLFLTWSRVARSTA